MHIDRWVWGVSRRQLFDKAVLLEKRKPLVARKSIHGEMNDARISVSSIGEHVYDISLDDVLLRLLDVEYVERRSANELQNCNGVRGIEETSQRQLLQMR